MSGAQSSPRAERDPRIAKVFVGHDEPNWGYSEVAAFLHVTIRMAQRLRQEGRIPYVKVGRYVRFRPSDIRAYRDAQVHGISCAGGTYPRGED